MVGARGLFGDALAKEPPSGGFVKSLDAAGHDEMSMPVLIWVAVAECEVARGLRFPAAKVVSRDDCLRFEYRAGHLMEQVLARGYRVADLEDPEARIMWDTGHERDMDRWALFNRAFGTPAPAAGRL